MDIDDAAENFLSVRPHVRKFSVLEYDNVYSEKEHLPNCHELLYILEGRMTLHLGKNLIFHAVPGDFLLIPAWTPHRDEFVLRQGLRILLVQFDWDALDYFSRVDNRALINVSYGTRCEAQRRLEFLRDRRENTETWKLHASLELHGILMLFYFDIAGAKEQGSVLPEPSSEILRRVKHYLDQNYHEQVTLKDAAAFAGLSPSYLSRQFHREYGIGFSAYLTARRLEAARHLLRDTKLQVEEVALRCGFGSGSYFIKVFRRHCGTTPGNRLASKPSGS